jgi:predicted nucleotidyltransferase
LAILLPKGVIMHETITTAMSDFTAKLKEVFASDFLALVVYGSATKGSYRAGVSDINVLVILEKCSAVKILELGRTAKTLFHKYRISPFIMTREEFVTSADVFPLEYSDILDAHNVVYGNKEIIDIAVNWGNLRLQLEEKLRGAIGDIRGMLIAAEGDEGLLKKLILQWSGLGRILFRGLLRLKRKSVTGMGAETILDEAAKEYGVSLEGFSVLNRLRQSQMPVSFTASSLADSLIEPLKALVRAVDAMEGSTL